MRPKTRILLIDPTDPWITNTNVLKHHDQVMLPIGLMYLSAYLKSRHGDDLEIKVISTIVDAPERADLTNLLKTFRPHIVGIRCVIFYSGQIKEIAATARRERPDALLIAGGPNVTFDNQNLQANADIDVLVEGEGEEILSEIVALHAEHGREGCLDRLSDVRGIMFRRHGLLRRNCPRPPIEALDELPLPDYGAIDLPRFSEFMNYGYNRRPMGILFTSRGCPFKCTYCHMVFGKGFRARSAGNIRDEIVHLHDTYGIEDFSIVDDNFTVDRARIIEFTDLMIDQGPQVRFYFPNGVRADSLTEALLLRLKQAGTIYMTFSLETASPRLQKVIKKHANIEKLRAVVERACELNIITNLCIMVGFPTETMKEAEYTLHYFAQFDKLVLPYYFSVKYYPGTELYHTAKDYGINIDEDAYRAPYHGYEFQETPLISREQFERLNQWYLRRIYLNPKRIRNAVNTLQHHFSTDEINDMFTLFFRRRIEDVEQDVLREVELVSC